MHQVDKGHLAHALLDIAASKRGLELTWDYASSVGIWAGADSSSRSLYRYNFKGSHDSNWARTIAQELEGRAGYGRTLQVALNLSDVGTMPRLIFSATISDHGHPSTIDTADFLDELNAYLWFRVIGNNQISSHGLNPEIIAKTIYNCQSRYFSSNNRY
jgi:hypothetical protein